MRNGHTAACLKQEGTQPVDRELFTMDKTVGPKPLKTFRNLAVSGAIIYSGITGDMTDLDSDFFYFVCKKGQKLFTVIGEALVC